MRPILVLLTLLVGCIGAGDDDVDFDAPVIDDAPVPDAPIDGSPFQCNNDSAIEPNEDPQAAFITPVASVSSSYELVGLAICPTGDRDHFRFDITVNGTRFEAAVTGIAGHPPLDLAVLNSSGTLIATGAPDSPPHVVRVGIGTGLAVGTYFVRVTAGSNSENNYGLALKTCQGSLPCP